MAQTPSATQSGLDHPLLIARLSQIRLDLRGGGENLMFSRFGVGRIVEFGEGGQIWIGLRAIVSTGVEGLRCSAGAIRETGKHGKNPGR